MSFLFSVFPVMIRIIPIAARTGENEDGFNSWTNTLPLLIPLRDKIHEVTVVPMFAPMIMPTTCPSFMIPEFTKPTTITVVAEEDWITAVTPAPRRTAIYRFLVSFSSTRSRRPPASLARPSPNTFIPYKNNASPPIMDNTEKIFIEPSIF